MNEFYSCKQGLIKATDYAETMKKARRIFHNLERKRDTFVRSAYFNNDKVFINSSGIIRNQRSSETAVEDLNIMAAH